MKCVYAKQIGYIILPQMKNVYIFYFKRELVLNKANTIAHTHTHTHTHTHYSTNNIKIYKKHQLTIKGLKSVYYARLKLHGCISHVQSL